MSCEWNDQETNWTQLIPIPARHVRAAFDPAPAGGPSRTRPQVRPQGQPQGRPPQGFFARLWSRWNDLPFDGEDDLVPMFGLGLAAALVALLAMTALAGNGGGIAGQMNVTVDGGATHGEYGPVTVARPSQMVTMKLAAQDFTNKWIDVDLSLVNRQTHQAITASTTIQHYSGADSDGSWSEGALDATAHFADVPRGAYNLIVEAQGHTWRGDNAALLPAPVTDPAADPAADAVAPWAPATPASEPAQLLALGFVAEMGGMDWALFWTVAGLILIVPTGIFLYRLSGGRYS